MIKSKHRLHDLFGPGLILAAAAVGVSHLVQSTRAGAEHGLALLFLIVLAAVVKYPSFKNAAIYANTHGASMVSGYKQQGRWALGLFAIIFILGVIPIQTTIVMTTTAIMQVAFDIELPSLMTSTLLLLTCLMISGLGGYKLLDKVIKVLMLVLVITTIVATCLVMKQIPWQTLNPAPYFHHLGLADLMFWVALIGWMPAPIEVSVWHSVWCAEKEMEERKHTEYQSSMLDFDVGYIGTIVLAFFFVALGAAVMFTPDIEFPADSIGFAEQLMALYTQAIGSFARPVIAVSAFAVMLSTSLAVIDVSPRLIHEIVLAVRQKEITHGHALLKGPYFVYAAPVFIGTLLLLTSFKQALLPLVDMTTTLSFLTAPILAYLNHRAMLMSPQHAQSRRYVAYSALCIGLLLVATLYFISMKWIF